MKKQKTKLPQKAVHRISAQNPPKAAPSTRAESPITEQPPAIAGNDGGMEAMSRVIIDFAAPLLETCHDADSEKKAISLAIFIWNTALLPEPEQQQTLDTYLSQCEKNILPDELKTLSAFVDRLVRSKKTRYADIRSKITSCTIGKSKSGDQSHIEVGYTLE